MKLLNLVKVSIYGSIVTYRLSIGLDSTVFDADLTTDMDGSYASWSSKPPSGLEIGGGLWYQLIDLVDKHLQVQQDFVSYYEEKLT